MDIRKWIVAGAAVALLAGTPPHDGARAALTSNKDDVPVEKTWNPHPADDDIVLPMPCGLNMTLRAVAVPSGGLMQDKRFVMGIAGAEDAQRQIYERRFEAYISAPFRQADLPARWSERLPQDERTNYLYYFIGKYEISEHQWAAVMDDACPTAPSATADLPKRDISWFDVQAFLRKYNQWLVDNAKDNLPHFKDNPKNIGFLRLPSEEEWEFAARGGSRVREEDRNHEEIFPLGDGKLEDYGVFTTPGSIKHAPLPIGSRRPNPLGLYDTAGNVKELVQGFFRFSVADQRGDGETFRRLHGAAGGILCKGGSYMSDEKEVLPGWRDEVPQYTGDGESRRSDLGFRVALSGINVPSGTRLKQLVAESARLADSEPGTTSKAKTAATPAPPPQSAQADVAVKLDPSGNPLVELDKVSGAAATPEMRGNLSQLRGIIEDMNSAQERQRDEILDNSLRSVLYQTEALRNVAYRYWALHGQYQNYKKLQDEKQKQGRGGVSEKQRRQDEEQIQVALNDFFDLLLASVNFYKSGVQRLAQVPESALSRHLVQLRKEYAQKDLLSEHMRQNMDVLEQHLKVARKQGIDSLSKQRICKDVIPSAHYTLLPFK